jgi:hypothetical protein
VRATLLNPTGPADWVNISFGGHTEEPYKALAEIGGVPAIVYVTSPAAGVREVRYAYGTMPAPSDLADFTVTYATEPTAAGHFFNPSWLVEQDGQPAFTYWSSLSEQLCLARVTSNPPVAPTDWTSSPLSAPATSGSRCALIDWQGLPLALHGGIGGDHLRCARGTSWQPESLSDWECHTADAESMALDHVAVCQLPDGVAAVYRDTSGTGELLCAWFSGTTPAGAGDWCVMQVMADLGADGGQAIAALPGGMPAIIYGDTDDNEVWLATMDPP